MDPVDVLAFGPHPDDIELGAGATLAKHAAHGSRVGLCDLTRGEIGSNGTPEERVAEAEAASRVLGAVWRRTLGLPDRQIGTDPSHVRRAAELIRHSRPRVIAIPYWEDRHPDHGAASRLLTDAVFNAGLRRYPIEGEAWRAEWVCYYFINDAGPPSFVVDVSDHYEIKRRALECHRSQFAPDGHAVVSTRLTSPRFMQLIETRDAQFGALAGVQFAEAFVVREPVVLGGLFKDAARERETAPRPLSALLPETLIPDPSP
jgi:bacillithiol biosynthesis deacetylase BshB1